MLRFIFKFMKKIILLLFILFFSYSAAFSKSFPFNGDLSLGTDSTRDYWNSYINLVLPILGTENSFLFLSPKLSMTGASFLESSTTGNSIGVGYRKYHDSLFNIQSITGINIYYDNINTKTGNTFQQLGMGLEFFTNFFDFRVNGYVPFSDSEKFLNKSFDILLEHKIAATYYYEAALLGFDTEIGIKLPIPNKFGYCNILGGYYMFKADKLEEDLKGFKAKIEYNPINILKLSYTIFENQNLQQTNWMTNISLNIPFNFKKFFQTKNPLSFNKESFSLKNRMGKEILRDTVKISYPKIKHHNEILKFDEENDCYFIVASVNGNGDGTFENPANLTDAMTLAKANTGNNSILLLLGGKYDVSSTINLNDFNAENILITGKQEIEYLGADLSKITKSNPVIVSTNTTIFDIENLLTKKFTISSIEFLSETENVNPAVEIKNMEKEIILKNNSFKNFKSAVNIIMSSSETVVYNNIFQDNVIGLNLEETSAVVRDNIFSSNTTNAINIYKSDDITLYSNLIKNNACGINIDLSENTKVLYNEFSSNNFAINSSSSSYIYISNNIIYNSKETAIMSDYDTQNQIMDNIIIENEKNGINMKNGDNNYIYNNEIIKNKLNGILAEKLNSCYISKNDINNNIEAGIALEDSNYTEISTNTVSYNKIGISLKSGDNIYVSSNTIHNSETAVHAIQVSTLSVVSNTISSSTVLAISLSNMENGLIKANFISNTTGIAGIYAENLTGFSFENNNFSQNSGSGLNIKNSKDIFLMNNMFNYSNGNGLTLYNSTNISLFYNIFNNNNAISTVFGLYLKNNINFTSSSGNNIFYNSNYSGDVEAVDEYEQNVKPNDNFY